MRERTILIFGICGHFVSPFLLKQAEWKDLVIALEVLAEGHISVLFHGAAGLDRMKRVGELERNGVFDEIVGLG